MTDRICFVELPTTALAPSKAFYEAAFAFTMSEFGPSYASTMTGDIDLGLQADAEEATHAPLPVIRVVSLEITLERVLGAGGFLTKPIFAFPGGRRVHFRDPAGNELAAMQSD